MTSQLKFIDKSKAGFYVTLKERVDNYFTKTGISRFANRPMIEKTVFFITLQLCLYTLILVEIFPLYVQLLLSLLLGINMACIGFNICHDALHNSYSSKKTVNQVLGLLFNVIGANAYLWSLSHNKVHHTYTNIPDHDEDIEIAPGLIRITEGEKVYKIHRFQQIYAFFLYSLASLSWFFRKDYVKFFQTKIGNTVSNHPRKEYFNLFFFKMVYYAIFIIIPLVVMDITWWQFLIGYIAMNLAEGLVLGLVFQLAHVVEATQFPVTNDEGNIEENWAVHQMKTTANFSPKSHFANFFCGGLNMQIEHHLFPKTCHIHYRELSDIVKTTAQEFNIPYHENKSFFSALKSHYKLLKKMGNPKLIPEKVTQFGQKLHFIN